MTPVDREPGQSRAPSRVISLEKPLLADIRDLLVASTGKIGAAFTLIDLDEHGLRGSAVDAETGHCLIELNDHTLHAQAFDRAIADYMVRSGKAQMPETAEWARELVDLMPQARLLLGTSVGTFLMGKTHVGLLRVTRADLDEALAPSIVRAISVARSVAIASPAPVQAAVMMPNHSAWPGLTAALGTALSDGPGPHIPVVPLKNPSVPPRSGRHARPPEPDPSTSLLTLPPAVSAPVLPARLSPLGLVSSPTEVLSDPAAVVGRQKQNRLILVGAALVSVLIIVGCAALLAAPWRDDAGEPRSQRYLTPPDSTVISTSPPSTPSTTPAVPPINVSAARAPIVKYTTPPPPPPPSTTTRRPAPRPPRNTIPNPIPGQPPIVLP